MNGSGSGDPQSVVFSKTDLGNGTHTIKCTIVERDGRMDGNLDYLKIFSPGTSDYADKADLQDAITECSTLVAEAYDAAKWADFKAVYNEAVKVMNDADAKEDTVKDVAERLLAAKADLGEPSMPTPVIGEAKGGLLHVERTRATVSWDAVKGAASYIIRTGGTEVQTLESTGDMTTTDTWYTLTGLQPNTMYEVQIFAVNALGDVSEDAIRIPVETTAANDTEGPGSVTEISKKAVGEDAVELSWKAPEDEDLAGYNIYIDNIKAADLKDKTATTWKMENLTVGQIYVVKITAYDQTGNTSIPAQFSFTFSVERIIAGITVDPSELAVKKGTAFKELKLPKTVDITYKSGLNEKDVPVKWDKGDYKADEAGVYTIYGELKTDIAMDNPDELKPAVKVTVKDTAVDPAPDPDPTPDPDTTPDPDPSPDPNPSPNPNPNPSNPGGSTGGGNQNNTTNNNSGNQGTTGSTAKDTVKTGDQGHPAVWAATAAAAVLLIAVMGVVLRRRKRK